MGQYFTGYLIGMTFGASVMAMYLDNINKSVANSQALNTKLVDICIMADSVPVEYDSVGELICENGASFNYSDFK
tara:strand:- start:100 stop:324 length:225 start_codon:yes stop_codon:yes gene_type:complete